jgi:membrane fusion protein, copper/silver efflux system
MKKAGYFLFFGVLLAGAFLAGSWQSRRETTNRHASQTRKILYYVDPMHPAYKSDKPGIAPDCGMELVPVYAGEAPAQSTSNGGSAAISAGTVTIGFDKQQLSGVRVSRVEKVSGTYKLRLFGRVAPDETRVFKLNAGVDGFVREVSAVTTGSQVRKNQWLATFSAPNARQPIQAYLVTLGVLDRQQQSASETAPQVRAANDSSLLAIDRLQNLGLSSIQIEEIRRTREVPTDFRILAPVDGFVTARSVTTGQKFDRGSEWYRIADLKRVWILADVFAPDAQYLRPGVRAQVSLPNQNTSLPARVSDVLPQFDSVSATLKVRLEAENPGYLLRPDMFVDVELRIAFPATIAVPVDAVLDSGLKKTVFVDRGEGFFEPREVEMGWRFGDRVEIVKGLAPGEQIVVAGNFLISSESRLKTAVAGMSSPANEEKRDGNASLKQVGTDSQPMKDPACGMDVDQSKAIAAGRTSTYRDKTYYFCSDSCKRKFDSDANAYLKEVVAPPAARPTAHTTGETRRSPAHEGRHG